MSENPLAVSDRGSIRLLTIDRPKRLNALNASVFQRLAEELARAADDRGVRVLVITGVGDRAFSAGADLDELADRSPVEAKALLERGQRVLSDLECIGKPVIAAVNGFALGGGLELALACSFAIGSDKSRVGLPEVGLGLIPGYGGTQRLPRLVGRSAALRMMLSGEMIDAAEAFRLGIFAAEPLSSEGFEDAVLERAEQLASKGPVAQRLILDAVDRGNIAAALTLETAYASIATSSADGREGVAAFREKRDPQFKGEMV